MKIKELKGGDYYLVSAVCRDDIEQIIGRSKANNISDELMDEIAESLGSAIEETCYWECLQGVLERVGLQEDRLEQ